MNYKTNELGNLDFLPQIKNAKAMLKGYEDVYISSLPFKKGDTVPAVIKNVKTEEERKVRAVVKHIAVDYIYNNGLLTEVHANINLEPNERISWEWSVVGIKPNGDGF